MLAGRRAKEIMQALTTVPTRDAWTLAIQCLVDEVQLAPADLDAVLEWAAQHWPGAELATSLFTSKFADRFEVIIRRRLSNPDDSAALSVIDTFMAWEQVRRESEGTSYREDLLCQELAANDPIVAASAATAVMYWAFWTSAPSHDFSTFATLLEPLLQSPAVYARFAAAWAYTWIARHWDIEQKPRLLLSLAPLWDDNNDPELREMAAWATCELARNPKRLLAEFPIDARLETQIETIARETADPVVAGHNPADAALTLKYYLQTPFTEADLNYLKSAAAEPMGEDRWPRRMLHFITA